MRDNYAGLHLVAVLAARSLILGRSDLKIVVIKRVNGFFLGFKDSNRHR